MHCQGRQTTLSQKQFCSQRLRPCRSWVVSRAAAAVPAAAPAAAQPAPAPAAAAPRFAERKLLEQHAIQPWRVITRSCQVVASLLKLTALTLQHNSTGAVQGSVRGAPGGSSSGNGSSSINGSKRSQPTADDAAAAAYGAAVRAEVSSLGPLWVKLGQTLSVRADVTGPHLAAALAGLQEGAPPFEDAVAAAIITEELGSPPSQLFSWIKGPVASASLGQVYQAQLPGPGAPVVAVKVQRPGVWQQLQLDLSILLLLLRGLKAAARIQQDITSWAATLAQGLAEELDYEQEGRNLERFAAAIEPLGFVTTPSVVWHLTSTRVLTTSWMEGQTPGQILRQARQQARGSAVSPGSRGSSSSGGGLPGHESAQQQLMQLLHMGVEASLSQLVTTRLLHADPHPGNLLLTPQGQLAYLDFGLLVTVPEPAALAMMSGLLHWALADFQGLAADLGDMGLLKPTTDMQQLAADLQQQFQALNKSSSSGSGNGGAGGSAEASVLLGRAAAISFGDFAGVVARLALKYRFELPSYYTLVIRSLTTLEGFALLVDPGARQHIARWAVRSVARQLLSDERPAALQLLQQLLLDPQQPGQLNLPLLEELLLLHEQHNAAGIGIGIGTLRRPQKRQLVLLDKLVAGLEPQQLAAQLSGPRAAAVRGLLAQGCVRRLLHSSSSAAAAAGAGNPPTRKAIGAATGQRDPRSQPTRGQEQQEPLQQEVWRQPDPASSRTVVTGGRLKQVVWWLVRAGPRGLLLALQLCCLAAAVAAAQAVRVVAAAFKRLKTPFPPQQHSR